MSSNIIAELITNISYLTKIEQKIANLIIEDPEKFITFSLKELSEKTGVSQGSIINFSNKYASGGFPELKLQISACMHTLKQNPDELYGDGVFEKNLINHVRAFKLTAQVNDESTLIRVSQMISSAEKVEIYGVYRSAVIATDFCYQLMECGISASSISDILTCAVSASMLNKNSLVIVISSSGKTKDIIDAVKNAKRCGSKIVCITSNINSPLAKLSDEVLISAAGDNTDNSPTEVRLSQMLLTSTVCSIIKKQTNPDNENRRANLVKILNSHNVEESDYE